MPEGLTQTKTPTFSETRPEIDRNGGRLQIGTVAGFTSEYPAGINRNPHRYMTAGSDDVAVPSAHSLANRSYVSIGRKLISKSYL